MRKQRVEREKEKTISLDSAYSKMWKKRRWKRDRACQSLIRLALVKQNHIISTPSHTFLQTVWELMTNQSHSGKFETKHNLSSLPSRGKHKNQQNERKIQLSFQSQAEERELEPRNLARSCSLTAHFPNVVGA